MGLNTCHAADATPLALDCASGYACDRLQCSRTGEAGSRYQLSATGQQTLW